MPICTAHYPPRVNGVPQHVKIGEGRPAESGERWAGPTRRELSTTVPGTVRAVRVYVRNCAWGNGESDMGSRSEHLMKPTANTNHVDDPPGWCRAGAVEVKGGNVSVTVYNWLQVNSREVRMEIDYDC